MIYDYSCECGPFEVIKSMKDSSNPENCPKCGKIGTRIYTSFQLSVKDFKPDYYHSLGKVFTNKKDLQYHLDKNNMVAIGNDFNSGEKMQQSFAATREEKQRKSWEDIEI